MSADVRFRLKVVYAALGAVAVALVFVGAFAIGSTFDGVRVETEYEPVPPIGPGLSYGELRSRFGAPSAVTTCGDLPGLMWTDGRSWQVLLCSPDIRG